MGRPLRYLAPGALYHVSTRGNNKAPIVVDDDDRIVFVHILNRVVRRYGWRLHVRCLLGNHYHLVVETPEPNLSDGTPSSRATSPVAMLLPPQSRAWHVTGPSRRWSESVTARNRASS